MTRYARRVDLSQNEIATTLQRLGFAVRDLSRLGSGAPDLVTSWDGHTVLVECKTPKHHDTKRQAENQRKWREGWEGEVVVLKTADEALAWALNRKRATCRA